MMATQTVTLELPEVLYRSVTQVSQITNRPIGDVLQESLKHFLPPLDDVPHEEAEALAQMSILTDVNLWRISNTTLSTAEQNEFQNLLEYQAEGPLLPAAQARLQALMDEYGRLLVRKSYAWLLLARRGYRVPVQPN